MLIMFSESCNKYYFVQQSENWKSGASNLEKTKEWVLLDPITAILAMAG